jgi:FkbM family methyltransferase
MNLPVWIYWEGECPEWIVSCRKTIFTHSVDVRLVTPSLFDEMRNEDRDINLDNYCIAHRADFIRSFLIAKYGGIWIDSDTIVMKSLQPLLDLLITYDFIGYRERSGFVTNNFMGARVGSRIASGYYQRVCNILRSGKPIEWLTIGSEALTAVIEQSGIPWFQIQVEQIQPICWSDPKAFFTKRSDPEHEAVLNRSSFCYMLSRNMINGVINEDPEFDLLHSQSFFSFLIRNSLAMTYTLPKRDLKDLIIDHRMNTDDDKWVIPEVIRNDMYQIKEVVSLLEPEYPVYVVDCGAHIGTFSIMCSLYLNNAEIIAFEPNPESFYYLKKNADRYGHIFPQSKAVGIKEGTLNLYSPDQEDWSGRWTSLPNSNPYFTVETVNLFEYLKTLDKPVFILKMDLEGYEDLIINEASTEDLKKIKMLILETHTDYFNHDKLKECGFELLFRPAISSDRQFVYRRCHL